MTGEADTQEQYTRAEVLKMAPYLEMCTFCDRLMNGNDAWYCQNCDIWFHEECVGYKHDGTGEYPHEDAYAICKNCLRIEPQGLEKERNLLT